MKLNYFPDTVSLYVDLMEQPGTESKEMSEGVVRHRRLREYWLHRCDDALELIRVGSGTTTKVGGCVALSNIGRRR